jgi:3-isopropylmalate/(R)-2-methylmalate dehydratase small subunit
VKPFRSTTGKAAVLDRPDVDTDQIMPKQFLKRIERTGFGELLFYDWRYDADGRPRPDFELNNEAYAGARILLAGRNFGCGSSREHAPWGLQEYGFDVVIAPSFGDIFASNCVKIGLVPIVLPSEQVKQLMELAERDGAELTVDLEQQLVLAPGGEALHFSFDPAQRHRLLNGLDDIGLSLEHEADITAYEKSHAARVDTVALR